MLNRSALDASISYLREKSDANLRLVVSTPGGRLAYAHHRWSNPSSRLTAKAFWKKELQSVSVDEHWEDIIEGEVELLRFREKQWLATTLKYLPPRHTFHTTVHLIGGYDSVVYGEDVALNLAARNFQNDRREAVYYLIHELAHAGYLRYHRMPDLAGLKTFTELFETIRFLTHLEGMGVVSSFQKRIEEGGLSDSDYRALLDEDEMNARVREYFTRLTKVEKAGNRRLDNGGLRILGQFSAGPRRLWYATGCHMALAIEGRYGTMALRKIVKEGHRSFYRAYSTVEDPLSL